jgi:hypothetical protein
VVTAMTPGASRTDVGTAMHRRSRSSRRGSHGNPMGNNRGSVTAVRPQLLPGHHVLDAQHLLPAGLHLIL